MDGGEGLTLSLTDCLHLLSELCHMRECTSWLLLGERRRPPPPPPPLQTAVFFKWSNVDLPYFPLESLQLASPHPLRCSLAYMDVSHDPGAQ